MTAAEARTSDQQAESEQRVTALELFFDLVFVFAITQVTGFLADNSTWEGLLQGLFLLGALWWAWAAYAWLTNTLNPEEGVVRIAVFASMAAMLIAALAVPGAFGAYGLVFGVAYFIVRALHLVLYAIAGRGDRELMQAVLRIAPSALTGAALLVVAGFTDGPAAAHHLGRRIGDRLPVAARRRHARLARLAGALRRAPWADHHHRPRGVDRRRWRRRRRPTAGCRRRSRPPCSASSWPAPCGGRISTG